MTAWNSAPRTAKSCTMSASLSRSPCAARASVPASALPARSGWWGAVSHSGTRHLGARFGPEILDDDFLDVAVAIVEFAYREQAFDAFAPRFAGADQDAGGEWHACLAGQAQGFEAHMRILVGRSIVRHA